LGHAVFLTIFPYWLCSIFEVSTPSVAVSGYKRKIYHGVRNTCFAPNRVPHMLKYKVMGGIEHSFDYIK